MLPSTDSSTTCKYRIPISKEALPIHLSFHSRNSSNYNPTPILSPSISSTSSLSVDKTTTVANKSAIELSNKSMMDLAYKPSPIEFQARTDLVGIPTPS
jgi:hypothetical protein